MFDPTPIIIVFIVVGLPIICSTLLLVVHAIKGGKRKRGKGFSDEDEARLIQELHRGLTRLEDRVESLETLLVEREAARKSSPLADR